MEVEGSLITTECLLGTSTNWESLASYHLLVVLRARLIPPGSSPPTSEVPGTEMLLGALSSCREETLGATKELGVRPRSAFSITHFLLRSHPHSASSPPSLGGEAAVMTHPRQLRAG